VNAKSNPPPVLEVCQVSKRFGAVQALQQVQWRLFPGRIHALVGANGAGKSTLLKILSGALQPDEGHLRLAGRPVRFASPQDALAAGVATVYQELSGVGSLSVAENLFLGRQPVRRGRVDWSGMVAAAREILAPFHLHIDPRRRLDRYPLVVRQVVEVARAVHRGARVLLLDEPTSALSAAETEQLFRIVAQLAEQGVAVVFISHFLDEVLRLCHQVTVLREGRVVLDVPTPQVSQHQLIQHMLGAEHRLELGAWETTRRRLSTPPGEPVLQVCGLELPGVFRQVELELCPGECLGLFGLAGAGHLELVEALAGALRPRGGSVLLEGTPLPPGRVAAAVGRGVVLVSGDRARELNYLGTVAANTTVGTLRRHFPLWITRRAEQQKARGVLQQVGCRPLEPGLPVGQLSGGNQQKVVFARWLLGQVKVLLLQEPTRGMDVGAKEEVMQLVGRLKRQGAAVLLASSEPELVLAHADRILVMRRGRVVARLHDCQVDKAQLMQAAS